MTFIFSVLMFLSVFLLYSLRSPFTFNSTSLNSLRNNTTVFFNISAAFHPSGCIFSIRISEKQGKMIFNWMYTIIQPVKKIYVNVCNVNLFVAKYCEESLLIIKNLSVLLFYLVPCIIIILYIYLPFNSKLTLLYHSKLLLCSLLT